MVGSAFIQLLMIASQHLLNSQNASVSDLVLLASLLTDSSLTELNHKLRFLLHQVVERTSDVPNAMPQVLQFRVQSLRLQILLVLDSLKPIADNESFVSVSVSPRKCKKFGCAFILRLISWIF